MNYFEFNGYRSKDFDIRIQKKNVYSGPKRDISLTSIPGRNGEIISSNKRFSNVSISYTCFIVAKSKEELANKVTSIKNWLYKEADSYHDLKDSYDTLFKRSAVFNNKLDISDEVSKIGTFTVTFSCKPLRYLLSGLEVLSFTGDAELNNPYITPAKPYIKIYGSGNGRLILSNSEGNHIWEITDMNSIVSSNPASESALVTI